MEPLSTSTELAAELRPGRQGPAKQPYALVNEIFGVMLARYGSQWLSRWDGVPLEHVKEDWRGQLAGLPEGAIRHGLENLPAGRTPDAGMFRAICREWRPPVERQQARIVDDSDKAKADPERMRALQQRFREGVASRHPKQWAHDVIAAHKRGETVTPARLEMAKAALGLENALQDLVRTDAEPAR
jgi:hypothetical protein